MNPLLVQVLRVEPPTSAVQVWIIREGSTMKLIAPPSGHELTLKCVR